MGREPEQRMRPLNLHFYTTFSPGEYSMIKVICIPVKVNDAIDLVSVSCKDFHM